MFTTTQVSVKLTAVSDLIRLPKQYGTLLLLWPTMWSLVIATGGRPAGELVVIFAVGTFLMRSAGCAINDIADRRFDPHVERTKKRPLASGRLRTTEALFVFCLLSLLAFGLVLLLNPLTIVLSLVGIILAATYPFVKRVSHLPQAFLGMAFGWGAVMAWSAATGTVSLAAILIFAANIFFSTAYDTIYALMDIEDDLRIGVKSTAILFGGGVYTILRILYLCFGLLLAGAGWASGAGAVHYAGIALVTAALLVVVSGIRKNPTHETAFRAFLANAVAGGVILAVIIIDTNI